MAKKQAVKSGKKEAHVKEWAKLIFLREDTTQKDIALKVGVSEKTIGRWVADGKWEALKTTLLTTKEQELKNLYEVLSLLNKANKLALEDDDPDTIPDTDGTIKIAKAIKYLETQTGMGETYETMMAFLTFVQRDSLEHAQLLNRYADAFIKERLNSY